MNKAEKILRSYFDIGEDLNAEHVQAFALTLHDMLLEFGEECFNAGKKYGIDCAISAEWCEEVTEPNFENYLNTLK